MKSFVISLLNLCPGWQSQLLPSKYYDIFDLRSSSHSAYLTSSALKFNSYYMKKQDGHFLSIKWLQPVKGMVIKKGVAYTPLALICFQHA